MTSRERRIFWWTVGIFLALFPCACLGIAPALLILETVAFLSFGWIGFLWKVVPKIQLRWDIAATSAIAAVVLVIGSHSFLRWLYREIHRDGPSSDTRQWRLRWTMSGAGLVLLMFSAGIGAVGVVHQTTWLVTSPQRLVYHSSRRYVANRVKCASNLRQIGMGIASYTDANGGRYPDDLPSLFLSLHGELTAEVFICPSSNDEMVTGATTQTIADSLTQPHRCSYIYFGHGLSKPVAPDRVIAAEPQENHNGDGMNILFGDGHVEWIDKDNATKLLATVSSSTQPTTRSK